MRLRGYSFHSVKGGVGKSTLAVNWAVQQARLHPEVPVFLIDMDLTGTSLADVLPLRAPAWRGMGTKSEPILTIDGPPDEFLPRKPDTVDRIEWRDEHLQGAPADGRPAFVPFLNDYLLFHPQRWDREADLEPRFLTWRMEGGPANLHVLPSSALPYDLRRIVPVVFDEYYAGFLEGRAEWLFASLLGNDKEVVVVVDTPPTIPGLSRAIISLGLRLGQEPKQPLSEGGQLPPSLEDAEITWRAGLVTTPDLQDLRAAARWYEYTQRSERSIVRLLLNRVPGLVDDDARPRQLLQDALNADHPLLVEFQPLWAKEDASLQQFRQETAAADWGVKLPGLWAPSSNEPRS